MYEVYAVTCAVNGKVYIGYTFKGAQVRFEQHLLNARWKRAGALYDAMRKYGSDVFSMEIVWAGETHAQACDEERRLIAALGTMAPTGYNLTRGGDGVLLTREQYEASNAKKRGRCSEKQRLANQTRKGRANVAPENRLKIVAETVFRSPALKMTRNERNFARRYAAGLIGRRRSPMTEKHRQAIIASKTGKSPSEETRAKLRAANLGRVASADTREKQRLASSKLMHSAETRALMSRVQKGRTFSDESRAKMSISQRGHVRSIESIVHQKQTWVIKHLAKQAACTYFGGF